MHRTLGVAAGLLCALIAAPALAGGGGCHQAAQTEAATVTVRMTGSCFGPTVARVAPGDTVTFVNDDPVPHTVTGAHLLWGSTDPLGGGGTVDAAFDTPGIYPYVCILHPGMLGAVVVGDADTPPYAVEAQVAVGIGLGAQPDQPDDGGRLPWMPLALGAALGFGLAAVVVTLTRRRSADR